MKYQALFSQKTKTKIKQNKKKKKKKNDAGTDNNPKADLDNINGQITILKQILIISMDR